MDWSSSSSEDEQVILAVVSQTENFHENVSTIEGRISCSRPNIDCGICSWYQDYLNDNIVYDADHIRRRFRIPILSKRC